MRVEFDGDHWNVTDERQLNLFIAHAKNLFAEHGQVSFKWHVGDQRTRRQNNAMWLWLQQLADALNEAGWDMKKTLKPHIEIPWDQKMAKRFLWNPIQEIITEQESSKNIKKQDVDKIQETIARHLAETTGISVPFPTRGTDGASASTVLHDRKTNRSN